jgi:hypothetical protein
VGADGYPNREPLLCQSLKTRVMARAQKRAAELEDPQNQRRLLKEAIDVRCPLRKGWLKDSTLRKYRNTLAHLRDFCERAGAIDPQHSAVTVLDAYRAGCALASGITGGIWDEEVALMFGTATVLQRSH